LIYLLLNTAPANARGWAVPTATDIAFAVGVLALLGRAIPGNLRVFLLALAIIDDVIAVLIIAVFYADGVDPAGFLLSGAGILVVLALQRIGIGAALPYLVPGALIWSGFLIGGVHPTLAGAVLGLLTPVRQLPMREDLVETVSRVATELRDTDAIAEKNERSLARPLRQLALAQREILPPVVRVQATLHPWVSYAVMPMFALANAGVEISGADLVASGPFHVLAGVALALTVGKPIGIVGVTWVMVQMRLGRLPERVSWGGILLIGLLGGIGFTVSIFIAMLGFADNSLLSAAKLGVLAGSASAAVLRLAWGVFYIGRLRSNSRNG
jgi:NhaA family Na+:H+ antiporter